MRIDSILRYPILLPLILALSACSGGDGDSVEIGSGSQDADPVVVEVAIAYVRHPVILDDDAADDIPVQQDLDNPLEFYPGAKLYWRSRADNQAEENDLTNRIKSAAVAAYNLRQGSNLDNSDVSIDIRHLSASTRGDQLFFAARIGVKEGNGEFDLDNTTWNLWQYTFSNDQLDYLIQDPLLREGESTHPYHDLFPVYVNQNQLVFSSTRQKSTAEQLLDDGRGDIYAGLDEEREFPALNLHSINTSSPIAETIQQISFNPSHDTHPVLRQQGDIIFTRWDNAPANGNSGRHLYKVNPSGRQTSLIFGYNSHDSGSGNSRVEFFATQELPSGDLLALVRPSQSNYYGGEFRLIDVDNYVDDAQRLIDSNNPAMAAQLSLTTTRVRTDDQVSTGGRFAAAHALDDGTDRLLVSWSECRLQRSNGTVLPCTIASDNEIDSLPQAIPNYGIWMYSYDDNTQKPVLNPQNGYWYSDIIAMENRDPVAIPSDRVELISGRDCVAAGSDSDSRNGNYSCELAEDDLGLIMINSVYDLDGVADTDSSLNGTNSTPTITIADRANPSLNNNGYGDRPARFIRLIKPVPLPDEDIKEVDNFAFGVSRNQLMREILGYAPIEPDGSVTVRVPANTALMLSVVDQNMQRISPRHNIWLELGQGEVLRCTGCHSGDSESVHGRRDNQSSPINPGAQSLGSGTVGFINTDTGRWFAPRAGASMAETWQFIKTEFDLEAPGRALSLQPYYQDEWAFDVVDADPDLDLAYSADISFEPGEEPNQGPAGAPLQRIVINYPDHIQAIWQRDRDGIEDNMGNPYLDANGDAIRNCLGCHSANTADGQQRIPAAQLDLSASASDVNADFLTSYAELLIGDEEYWINADNDAIVVRQYLCDVVNTNPDGSQFITQELQTATVGRSMSANGARSSREFFECFIDGLNNGPDRCTVDNTVPAGCTPTIDNPVVYQFPDPNDSNTALQFDHSGLLTRGELRLISEWLDIGAQYLNDPYHPLLAD